MKIFKIFFLILIAFNFTFGSVVITNTQNKENLQKLDIASKNLVNECLISSSNSCLNLDYLKGKLRNQGFKFSDKILTKSLNSAITTIRFNKQTIKMAPRAQFYTAIDIRNMKIMSSGRCETEMEFMLQAGYWDNDIIDILKSKYGCDKEELKHDMEIIKQKIKQQEEERKNMEIIEKSANAVATLGRGVIKKTAKDLASKVMENNIKNKIKNNTVSKTTKSDKEKIIATSKGVSISTTTLKKQGTSNRVGDFVGLKGASVDEVISRIPKDWIMKPQDKGQGIKFLDKNGNERLRIHAPGLKSPKGTNSHNGWILRINADKTGEKYFDNYGNAVGKKSNDGHIPLKGNLNLKK